MKKAFLFILYYLLLTTVHSQEQIPLFFAGKWEFNKKLSSPGLRESNFDSTVILKIINNDSVLTFMETWIKPGNPDFNTASETYKLDGKEIVTKSSLGTNKKTAEWTEDKKRIVIKNIDIQRVKGTLKNFIVIDTYSLSEDRDTLTIEKYSKNPLRGEKKVKKIYNKKVK